MYIGCRVSLVIPCYNEEEGLQTLLRDIPSVVDEVLTVDNNSTDATAAVARTFGAKVVFEPEKGYGNAYRTGFAHADGDIIVTMDADGMYPLESIERLVKTVTNDGYDFITTRRIPDRRRGFSSLLRYYGDVVLNIFTKMLFGVKLKDSQSGMWVFRKNILKKLRVESPGMPMSQELKIEAYLNPDVKTIEIPVLYRDERIGISKLNIWRDGFGNLFFLFKKRWRDRKTREFISEVERTTTSPTYRVSFPESGNGIRLEPKNAPENIHHHSSA